jgi:catechol 2,3-dioxygenase-like lactoylglutathione lyase family enzyme
MFDGIDHVVLPTSHLEELLGLYAGVLGFTVELDDHGPDPALAALLGLGDPPVRLCRLVKPGSHGGSLVLAEVPGLPSLGSPGPPARVGPYALDFYARDAAGLAEGLEAAGWSFTSPAVHYSLPGTELPVREQMLVQHHSGLLHAIVEHRPGGTRSVLGEDPDQQCSEVVAVVCLTPELDDARGFARQILGGQEYFWGPFEGPAVEEMLGMAPGQRLDAALFRGPRSRNARLEFAWSPEATPSPGSMPERVVLGLEVTDLDALTHGLGSSDHGDLGPVVEADFLGTRRTGRLLRSRYAATFALLSAPPR